ncbi:MAG: 16S rRNA (guanine(527)-N(7))-methyltransferase RsmG [Phototrophicaceae bacterium]
MTVNLTELAAQKFNLTLTPKQAHQFEQYHQVLDEWGKQMNLTTITDPDEVIIRHFLDSLSITDVIGFDDGDSMIDVGTGAGFPGLALAIAYPNVQVTLLDSVQKKLKFLQAVIDELKLDNVEVLHMRAEDAGNHNEHREQYDVVTARAVAMLPVLLEYTLPLAKVGGFMVAMKGESAEREIEEAKRALFILQGEAKPVYEYHLPNVERSHYLVTIQKHGKTPRNYPRQAGVPKKKPIGQ